MITILERCKHLPEIQLEPGSVLLIEGEATNKLYILIEGEMQILRGDVEVATASEPGAVFGEMAILLDKPHTATVKAVTPSRLYLIEDADAFMAKAPDLLFHVGKVMAHRLQLATGYLADIKSQFAEHGSHLSMVDEVLETLLHQQDPGFAPGGSSRDSGGSGC